MHLDKYEDRNIFPDYSAAKSSTLRPARSTPLVQQFGQLSAQSGSGASASSGAAVNKAAYSRYSLHSIFLAM